MIDIKTKQKQIIHHLSIYTVISLERTGFFFFFVSSTLLVILKFIISLIDKNYPKYYISQATKSTYYGGLTENQ